MRKNVVLLLLLLFLGLCLFISCSQRVETIPFGSITLKFGEDANESARTIKPSNDDLVSYITITSYAITGEYIDQCSYTGVQTSFSLNSTDTAVTVSNLIAGNWEVTVRGYNEDTTLVAEKTISLEVIQNQTATADIKLVYTHNGTGSLDFTLRVPASQPVVKVVGVLTSTSEFLENEETVDEVVVKTPTIIRFEIERTNATTEEEGAVFVYHILKDAIPVGSYSGCFFMEDADGDRIGLPINEAVHVYYGLTDTYLWTWSEAYFASAPPAPEVSLASGSYSIGQTVTITEADPLATVYYTLDGSDPSETNGTVYTSPITLQENSSFRVVARKGKLSSPTVEREYSILVATPVIGTVGGTYTAKQTVSITCSTTGASIYYYTSISSTPKLYSAGVEIEENATLYAYATKSNLTNSETVSESYIIDSQRSGLMIENPDTSDYGLTIHLPDSWQNGTAVAVGVTATLVAPKVSANGYSGGETVYNTVWLIDGEEITYPNGKKATGEVLKLGTQDNEYYLQAGGHIITVRTIVEDREFTANCLILVSYDGITTGENSTVYYSLGGNGPDSGGKIIEDKKNYDNGYRFVECISYARTDSLSYADFLAQLETMEINGYTGWKLASYSQGSTYLNLRYSTSTNISSNDEWKNYFNTPKTTSTTSYMVSDGTLIHYQKKQTTGIASNNVPITYNVKTFYTCTQQSYTSNADRCLLIRYL